MSRSDGGGTRPPAPASVTDPDFFDDAYYRVLEPFHTEAEARYEAGALRELLGLAQTDRVLDLGCGWGRHLRLLAGAGHDVVGVDLSIPLLRRAAAALRRQDPGGGAPRVGDDRGSGSRLVAGDMLQLPFSGASFDVVINLATSLGLFLEEEPAVRALAEARRVLRPGGRMLLEGMHRAEVEAAFAQRDAWTLDDGTEVRVRRRFDVERGISYEVLRWEGPGGSGTKRHALRIRRAEELDRLLQEAGLRVVERFGDWTGEPATERSPRMIAVAERP